MPFNNATVYFEIISQAISNYDKITLSVLNLITQRSHANQFSKGVHELDYPKAGDLTADLHTKALWVGGL